MNPFKLFNWTYLTDPTPGSGFSFFFPLIGLFILIFLASFKVKAWTSKHPSLQNIPSNMRNFALFGILLSGLRTENIPWLGMRLWLVLLFLGTLFYAAWLWKNYEKEEGAKPMKNKEEDKLERYLPRKKKKRN